MTLPPMDRSGAQPDRDADDLAAARDGDHAAFGRVVEPHRTALHAHRCRMLGSVQDAEDALQEALLGAWRGFAGCEAAGYLDPALHRHFGLPSHLPLPEPRSGRWVAACLTDRTSEPTSPLDAGLRVGQLDGRISDPWMRPAAVEVPAPARRRSRRARPCRRLRDRVSRCDQSSLSTPVGDGRR